MMYLLVCRLSDASRTQKRLPLSRSYGDTKVSELARYALTSLSNFLPRGIAFKAQNNSERFRPQSRHSYEENIQQALSQVRSRLAVRSMSGLSGQGAQSGEGEDKENSIPAQALQTSIILDNNVSGYLRRHATKRGSVGLHRKRFYKLDGAILSKAPQEGIPATFHVNIVGSVVRRLGKLHFAIIIKTPAGSIEQEDVRIILYAKTEELCEKWVTCLHSAATRTLETHYRIGQVIGEGGFASVRIGENRETKEIVAIKSIVKEAEFMQLYGREIAVVKRVEHPNIVRTFDLYETDKRIHIVMEFMRGGMLFDAIEDGLKFTEVDVAQLMREILHGVMYLHEHGVVHRDLKPENVLCTDAQPPWHVKIADFGLSKFTQNGLPSNDMLMKTMIGTPEFIAPEIALQQNYTSKVDKPCSSLKPLFALVWAVGMLMYNVVAGKLPFDDDETDFIGKLQRGLRLNFPEKEWANYSKEARLFTRALLCQNPEKRLTALGALVHPWLDDFKRFGSSRFSAHGRFSRPIFPNPGRDSGGGEATFKTQRTSMLFGPKRHKPSWLGTIIAVQAMNRFLLLVRPRIKPIPLQQKEFASRSSASMPDRHLDTEDESMDEDDFLSPMTEGRASFTGSEASALGEVDLEGSSAHSGAKPPRGLPSSPTFEDKSPKPRRKAKGQGTDRKSGPFNAKAAKFGIGRSKDGGTSPGGPARKASGLSTIAGPLRKASGLAASVLGGSKAPGRKGSIRGMFKKNPAANADPQDAAADFDKAFGLGDLDIQQVDDA